MRLTSLLPQFLLALFRKLFCLPALGLDALLILVSRAHTVFVPYLGGRKKKCGCVDRLQPSLDHGDFLPVSRSVVQLISTSRLLVQVGAPHQLLHW